MDLDKIASTIVKKAGAFKDNEEFRTYVSRLMAKIRRAITSLKFKVVKMQRAAAAYEIVIIYSLDDPFIKDFEISYEFKKYIEDIVNSIFGQKAEVHFNELGVKSFMILG